MLRFGGELERADERLEDVVLDRRNGLAEQLEDDEGHLRVPDPLQPIGQLVALVSISKHNG